MLRVYHGTESTSYLGTRIWDMLPENQKEHRKSGAF